MSWLFSQALVEEYLPARCLDGEQYAQLNVMPTPHPFWRNDKTTDISQLSQFGVTSRHLTEDRGEELLTLYQAAFHAKTSAPPERGKVSMAPDLACGARWRELSVKYDHVMCSWKTHNCLWEEVLPWSSVTLPQWGLMQDGVCWELMMSVLPTSASDAGLLPTPTATTARQGPNSMAGGASKGRPLLHKAALTWPTPTASLGQKGGGVTPRKSWEDGTLIEAVSQRMFATPLARDWRSGKASQATMQKNSRPLSEQIGGQLNPTWVEWLMGWPLGWTDLSASATAKFQHVQPPHGICLQKALQNEI